jgi:hypothetical protein
MSKWSNFARVASFAALGACIVAAPQAFGQLGGCRDDFRTHCADIGSNDRKARFDCLMAHKDELSDECLAQVERNSGMRQSRREACRAEVTQFCSEIAKSDRRAVGQCLNEHKSQLSEDCRAALFRLE